MQRRPKPAALVAVLAALVALPATGRAGVLPPLEPDPAVVEVPGLPDDPLSPLLPPLPPPPPPPGEDPPPPPQLPGITEPITLTGNPVVGQPLTLHATGRDPDGAINSIAIDFDDGGGLLVASACRLRPPDAAFEPDRVSSFSIPYAFTRPGRHTLRVTLGSGDCGGVRETTTQTIELNVASAKPHPAHVQTEPAATTAGAACRNANRVATRRNRRKVANATICVLNHVRRRHGLKPLRRNRKLRRAAALHNRHMLGGRFFAHQGPGEPSLVERIRRVRYRGGAGENLGAGVGVPYATPRGMVKAWMNSPVHRANVLERRFRTVGVVVAARKPSSPQAPGATYTAEFGTTRR